MGLYTVGKAVCSLLFKPSYRVEAINTENIPKDGGVLLCSNHISNLDPVLVGITSPRPIHFMAKAELFDVPVLKSILPQVHAFPVKRGMGDKQALRNGMQVLKDGHVLGLFPEGTRSKSGELGQGLSGVGFFALRTDAKVVPCAVIGRYKFLNKMKVVYGEPIDFEKMKADKASAKEVTEVIMEKIQELINKYQ